MMKDAYFIYSVSILAIVGVLVCFIGYATNTLPMHTPKQKSAITTSAGKKKTANAVQSGWDVLEKSIKIYLNTIR